MKSFCEISGMKKLKYCCIIVLINCLGATAQTTNNSQVITGAERMQVYLPMLKGKSVAVFANQTSMVKNTHLRRRCNGLLPCKLKGTALTTGAILHRNAKSRFESKPSHFGTGHRPTMHSGQKKLRAPSLTRRNHGSRDGQAGQLASTRLNIKGNA